MNNKRKKNKNRSLITTCIAVAEFLHFSTDAEGLSTEYRCEFLPLIYK